MHSGILEPNQNDNPVHEWLRELNDDYFFIEEQRHRGDTNLRFLGIPGGMWEGSDLQHFKKRIKLEFDRISKEINTFNAESQTNRKAAKFRPDSRADKDAARLLNGLFKKDFRNGDGVNAYDNAVQELSVTGVGHIRLSTDRSNDDDLEDESQKPIFDTLFDSYKTVIWDSNAKKIDKSDADHCHVLTSYTPHAFKMEFGIDADLSGVGLPIDSDIYFDWYNRGENLVWVAERYEIKKKKTKAIILDNEETGERKVLLPRDLEGIEDDLIEQGFKRTGTRKTMDRWVEKVIYSSTDVLEEMRRIPGKFIPIAPFYGYRTFINGREYCKGMVDQHKDAQRLINMVMSKFASISSTTAKEVPIVAPEQVKGHTKTWSEQHLAEYPYALLNPLTDGEGNIIAAGPLATLKPPQVDQHSQLTLQFANDFIREESAGAPADFSDPDASGVAIGKIIERQNMDTQPLFSNIERGMVRLGQIYRSIRTDISLPNEQVTVIGEDNRSESPATINETVFDEETGNLKVVKDITKGGFEVIVDTGPAYASQRKESVANLNSLLERLKDNPAAQEYMPLLLGAIIENIDGAGLEPLQEFNRNQMLLGGFIQPETSEEEQLVEQARQQQQAESEKGDPLQEAQVDLFKSTAANEAQKVIESQTKSAVNQANVGKIEADTGKIQAETQQIRSEIGLGFSKQRSDQNQNVIKFGLERAKLRQQGQQEQAKLASIGKR